jgi:hypothetical protein
MRFVKFYIHFFLGNKEQISIFRFSRVKTEKFGVTLERMRKKKEFILIL